jgi:hypothetical protein
LAERVCWEVARRDDARVARRLDRTQLVDGSDRLDAGVVLDDVFHFLQALGVMALLEEVHGAAIQRELLPYVQDVLRYGLKTWFGIESMHALPALVFSDDALMQLVGFNAQPVRQGICRRGAAKRQGARSPGPICPETLAKPMVKWNVRDLEAVCHGAIRALAKAGVFGANVTGMADATDLETTEHSAGGGQATRTRTMTAKRGKEPEIDVTVSGWKLMVLSDALTKIPLAVKVVPINEPEVLSRRALVTRARTTLAGAARLHKVVCDRGFVEGTDLWWLDQQGIAVVAKENRAVPVAARAQAAAGEGVTLGHRVHTVRHGQGQTAWVERRETEVVGSAGLTTDDHYGTPEPGRHHNRRDCEPNPIQAVGVRTWHGHEYGPGGNTVFLPNAPVDKPLQPFDDYDDRRRIAHCCLKGAKQPWDLGHPPQKTARAVRVQVVFTLLMCALATASRLQCERAARGRDPVGWHRGRRQLLEQSRDHVIGFAQQCDGLFPLAESSVRLERVMHFAPSTPRSA